MAAVVLLTLTAVPVIWQTASSGNGTPDPLFPPETVSLRILAEAGMEGVNVSVEGMPDLSCLAPCRLEIPRGAPVALLFRKEGFDETREPLLTGPDQDEVELTVRAPVNPPLSRRPTITRRLLRPVR